jgi:osmoprotectant transport system permease protein
VSAAAALTAGGPVIPNFGGGGSHCSFTQAFCWGWVGRNWGDTLQPALVEHIYITLIALGVGFVISLAAALVAYRWRWFERPFDAFSTILYTIPTLAFVILFIPFTGTTLLTMELALTGYTFLLLFRNILTGLRQTPPDAIAAATGMGMTRNEVLFKISLPLAIPSIMAGVRIASVTVIALAAIAALVTQIGLGGPIVVGLHEPFVAEVVIASLLTVALALVADVIFVLIRRAMTPWIRAQAKGVG